MTQQPYQAPPPPAPSSSMAMISMIAGIVGWILAPLIGSLVAIVTGHMAKREIRESMGQLGGDGMATAGLVLGYLQLVPAVLCICVVGIMLALGISVPVLDSMMY